MEKNNGAPGGNRHGEPFSHPKAPSRPNLEREHVKLMDAKKKPIIRGSARVHRKGRCYP